MAGDRFVPLPVRRVEEHPDRPLSRGAWPATIPAVAQLLADGLDLGRVTILTGENGTGKSTFVEAIAIAYGLGAEGGGTGARGRTYASESDLSASLRIVRGPGASRWGYFVRAETMHGLFTYLADNDNNTRTGFGERLHAQSHGESFLSLMMDRSRFDSGGFFVLDEPEAGLSFTAQLTLLGRLADLAAHPHGQLLIATHSPVIAALPGAELLQLDDRGITATRWTDLAVVDHYRRFCERPDAYLHHLFGS